MSIETTINTEISEISETRSTLTDADWTRRREAAAGLNQPAGLRVESHLRVLRSSVVESFKTRVTGA